MTNLSLGELNLFMLEQEKLVEIVTHAQFPKTLNYKFMLILPKVAETTKGGLILPEQSKQNALVGNNIGRIVGIGGSVGSSRDGALDDVKGLKLGEYVKYNPHSFEMFFCAGQQFILVLDQHLSASVPDPSLITDGIFKTFQIEGLNHAV